MNNDEKVSFINRVDSDSLVSIDISITIKIK